MSNDPVTPKKPSWWNESHQASWDKVKTSLLADWHKLSTEAHKLGKEAQEHAVSFGHGARQSYSKFTAWSAEAETQLKADWEKSGHKAGESWDKVRDAVKHGWDNTIQKLKV